MGMRRVCEGVARIHAEGFHMAAIMALFQSMGGLTLGLTPLYKLELGYFYEARGKVPGTHFIEKQG